MKRAVAVIGAPTSAGAFSPGQEDAPEALRAAGLLQRLREAGLDVTDMGDTPHVRWRPDHANPRAMNADEVRASALAVAKRVATAVERGLLPMVIGGDCTVELGTVCGWQRARPEEHAPLLYFDPHPDLNTPDSAPDGAFDWMGVAHLLGEPGAHPDLVDLGGRAPALTPGDVLVFGYSAARATEAERGRIRENGIRVIEQDRVAADPAGAARDALEWASRHDGFLLHFDADSIDFADLPLAENTDRNVGLTFATVMGALGVVAPSPSLRALTITEVNPHHGEPGARTLEAFLDRLAAALAPA